MEDMYALELSSVMLSSVTDKITVIKEWQARPLDVVYPIVWMDAMHYKLREDGRVVSKAVYTVLGVDQKGLKDVLGIYISESEGANL
jgi:transposase-like protein